MNGSAFQSVDKACGGVLLAPRRTEHTVLLRRSGMSADLSTLLSDPRKRQAVERRFLSYVSRNPDTGCWEWQGGRNRKGYGSFAVATKTCLRAHRVSFVLYRDAASAGMMVCHHCDNPSCVNPAHLFLGTRQDNSDDMVRKGRSARGERAAFAKLTASDVQEIRRRYAVGEGTASIGGRFGIQARNVSWVATGKAWSHLPGAVPPRRVGRRFLTDDQIRSIREMRSEGVSVTKIAARFGIHESAVRRNLVPRKKG